MSSTAPEIVILHGWSQDPAPSSKWKPVQAQLQNMNCSAKVLQLPGFELPLVTAWGVDEYVAWLQEKFQGKKNLILVGHSFGGHLALSYAVAHPQQVEKLILIASSGMRSHSITALCKRSGFLLLAKLGKIFTTSETLRRWLYRATRESDYLEASAIMRETMRRVIAHEVAEELSAISMPTTLIWGEQDSITPLAYARRLLAGIPQAKLQLIPDARHGIPFTHSKLVAQYICEAAHA